MPQVRLFVLALLGFSAFTLLSGCAGVSPVAPLSPTGNAIHGSVHGGQQPVTGATIQLYSIGTTGDGSAATPLGSSTTTAGDGSFSLTGKYLCSDATNGVNTLVYLVSTGGNPGLSGTNANLVMMAALGQCSSLTSGTFINIDEVTTVGSIAALYSPYMTSATNLGSASGDAAAFATAFSNVAEYTNTATGVAPGPSLPGGMYASSTEINTLSNIVASCVNSTGGAAVGSNSSDGTACGNLFNLTRNGGVAPTNTTQALINILNNPTQNASSLFSLPQPYAPFQPSLSAAPTTWSLPILTVAATPSISVAGGTYSSAQFVTLTGTTPGTIIHYTTDGSTPTSSSPTYNGTITVSSTETLKAIAVAGGYGPSAVASAAYTITGSTSTYTVSGQINLSNNCGGSIPPITVTLTQGSIVVQTTTTNSTGNFSFAGVPNDSYTVTPSITGPSSWFNPASQGVVVSGSSTNSSSFNASLGYTVSGTVAYSGSQTGQTYLALSSACGSGSGSLGTSISTTGAYTIRGVPPGSYTIKAWMDPLSQGVQNAIDPSGNASLTVTNANVTNASVTMIDPTFATPTSNPTIQNIVPNSQGALILFQSSKNTNSLEDANQYTVEWSTSPTLGGGSGGAQFASIAGSHTFTANGDKGLWVLTNASLTSGQTYYFQARSFNTLDTANPHPSGWCNYTSSGCSGTSGFTPVTIAPPACSGTCTLVSGSVTIPAAITIKPGAPLYLGLLQFSNSGGSGGGDPIGFYVNEIASPSNGANDFTVTAPSGSNYVVLGILDQNNNGGFGAGSITNIRDKVQANLTISGSTQTVAGITLPTSNSTATVSTQFSSLSCYTCGSTTTGYQLSFTVNGSDKLPVAVTLNSGPNMINNNGTVALDMGICTQCGNPQFEYNVPLPSTPNVGDTYGFTVTYSDGSQDTGTAVTGAVTGWNGGSTVAGASDAPTALAPANNVSIGTTPTFTWTDSSNATGANFSYSFSLANSTCSGPCTIWQIPGNNSKSNGFSNSITSIPWITSGNDVTGASNNLPTVSALSVGSTYNWYVQVQDSIGNSAQTTVWYQP